MFSALQKMGKVKLLKHILHKSHVKNQDYLLHCVYAVIHKLLYQDAEVTTAVLATTAWYWIMSFP